MGNVWVRPLSAICMSTTLSHGPKRSMLIKSETVPLSLIAIPPLCVKLNGVIAIADTSH